MRAGYEVRSTDLFRAPWVRWLGKTGDDGSDRALVDSSWTLGPWDWADEYDDDSGYTNEVHGSRAYLIKLS
jgi:hypothetical protein